jgi:hypothetical protein
VANPGLPQDIADPDLSGKAVLALQNRMDQQSYIYQENVKAAKRRDAEIYASMATTVYDAPRMVTIQTPDGNTQQVQLMRTVIDSRTGEVVVLNDLTNMEFDVYATIGPSYSSQKEQTRDRLLAMMGELPDGDPAKELLMLKLLEVTDGIQMDDVRDFARKRLILGGYKEPETEEELMMVQQAQGNQQPDANMVLAQAEMTKAQADMLREQREAQKDAADVQDDLANTQIKAFEAETDRMNSQIEAQKASAEINLKRIQGFSTRIKAVADTQKARADMLRGSARPA